MLTHAYIQNTPRFLSYVCCSTANHNEDGKENVLIHNISTPCCCALEEGVGKP